jgi:hypothetical protein
VGKELRELAASRSYWLMLLVVGTLVGHAFLTATATYAEASGAGGGPAALSQGLSPLSGIVVPTFGAYDLAATLLFPFVVIRLVAEDRETGALLLMLQAPARFAATMTAKGCVLLGSWVVAGLPGLVALGMWRAVGGHLYAPEVVTVLLGHLLLGALTIGIGAAAGALAASASSAAIVALTITLGTWALDYAAAARGGLLQTVAAYTPAAALRVFEHGEIRASTVAVLLALAVGGVAIATVWLHVGRPVAWRAPRLGLVIAGVALASVSAARLHASRDVSEDRRNSFSASDEGLLRRIRDPLHVTVVLAAEDPRLADLERGVLAKLRRVLPEVEVTYAARGRSGLFERAEDHYGEIWYEIGGRRAMSRSTTEEIVLEVIYGLAGIQPPTSRDDAPYRGYPLATGPKLVSLVFFALWPIMVGAAWWWTRRPTLRLHRRASPATAGA